MTPEELDRARAREALAISDATAESVAVIAARLARTGWEPIDPDLIEVREILKATLDLRSHARCSCREAIDAGRWDNGQKARATLAGIRRGRELERGPQ